VKGLNGKGYGYGLGKALYLSVFILTPYLLSRNVFGAQFYNYQCICNL